MPSLVVGAQSGGVPLLNSGANPYSGGRVLPGINGIELLVGSTSGPQFSGAVYVGLSGNITIQSGGGMSSGGIGDGMELVRGSYYRMALGANGIDDVWFSTYAASSGSRVYWRPY